MNIQSDMKAAPTGSGAANPGNVAGDMHGRNFFEFDHSLRDLLTLYCPDDLREHMWPHWQRLGEIAGNRLNDLAMTADKHPPVLHPRDRFGRDEGWIEHHPAYAEMEEIALGQFGLHAMSHMPGVLDWPAPVPPIAKYAFTYLYVQAEFGLMCPISLSDTGLAMMKRFGDDFIQQNYVNRMLTTDLSGLFRAAQFMTEKPGGSDVGRVETVARDCGDHWELSGEKWFCSNPHADVALLLARPEGAARGTKGLGMFVMPKILPDGSRNRYRIARLKDKLGTKSMASGEILLDGATAFVLGDVNNGIKQMMEQVNLSRLSHGVRAAAMMRRCYNEALVASRERQAFGQAVADMPLAQRQLMKLLVPTEQALSMYAYVARNLGDAQAGDAEARTRVRLATGLFKFRACRDNPPVATGSMEMRGGNGYIEDFIGPRLIRDAQIGLLWEGTSNINGLDVLNRAVAKVGAHEALKADLDERLQSTNALPASLRDCVGAAVGRAVALADEVARRGDETQARKVSTALYHATTAALMAWEGATLGARGGDARRLLLARMVLDHRLTPRDPLDIEDTSFDRRAAAALLSDNPVPLGDAVDMLTA
ncbi:MAG: acyl-CoA dehydrogenase family protein [Minwuia sp.]|uniref:acyl-CoA dehydrogenase family protein n=1 Tax=Minwuia sp. TaxID=2493630 RepID=UPI003A83F38D